MPTRDHGTFTRPTLAAVCDRAVPQGLAGPTPVRNPKQDRLLAAHDGVCRQHELAGGSQLLFPAITVNDLATTSRCDNEYGIRKRCPPEPEPLTC
jgi:hypothetical protein